MDSRYRGSRGNGICGKNPRSGILEVVDGGGLNTYLVVWLHKAEEEEQYHIFSFQ